MNKNVKNQKNIALFVLLAVTLALTQFQTLPASASFTFSTEKITAPNSNGFGWSVQKLDNGFAVGEPYEGSDDSGMVHIFDSDGNPGPTIQNPGAPGDNFGYSLSSLGNILAVGAPGRDDSSGTVYLFDISSPAAPTVTIQNPSGLSNERMGEDQINFIGNDLLVGISKATNAAHPSAGIIYQFSSGDGSIITQYTNPNGVNDNDLFGRSIAVNDPLILTGAHGALSETGEADVFGASNRISITNPNTNSPENQNDKFGWSTGITSDKYVISAPNAEVSPYLSNQIAQQGVVYLYDKISLARDTFTSPDGDDINFGQNIDDQFGYDVAVSDDLMLVGAPYDDVKIGQTPYINAGSVYLYQNGNLIATFHNPDPTNGGFFGQSVEIFNGQLLVGAPGNDGGAGAVYYTKISNPFAAKLDISAAPNPVTAGEDVTFTYTITNIGTADFLPVDDLTPLIAIADNDCLDMNGPFGDLGDDAILGVGEAWTFTCTKPAPTDPFTEAVDEGSTSITFDNDGEQQTLTCEDAEFPCNSVDVDIVSGGLTMTISATPQPAINGQTIDVDFDVFNTGTVSLFIEGTGGVVDNNANCTPVGENPDLIELTAQAHTHFTCQVTATNLPTVIDAVITAHDSDSNQVITATALYPLDILKTRITLDITSNPDPTYNGEQTTITYLVTNTGDLPLDIDGQTGVIESNSACTPVHQSGSLTMQPNDSVTFTCNVTGSVSPINFSATATALDQNNNIIPTSAEFTLNSIAPEITLDITSNPDPTYNGEQTTITYLVTNTGNSVLTIDQSAISEQNTACTPVHQSGSLTMQPTDSVTFTCNVTGSVSPINFSATATALDQNNREVTASSQFTLNVINPAIALGISAAPSPVNSGSISTVTYLVTNTGNSVLTIDQSAISEQNTACTPVHQSGSLTMQPTDSVTFTCNVTGSASPINFSATATALDQNNREVTASSQFTLQTASLTMNIVPVPLQPLIGSSPIVQFIVTNNGSVIFDTVAVDETLNAFCTPTSLSSGPLNPGNTRTFECTVPNVAGDFGIQGVATGTYTGGQFVVQNMITVDVNSELFCGLPKTAYDNVIVGDESNNNLVGTNRNDLIIGNGGNDTIKSKDGNDCVIGGNGNDKIWGGKGNDTLEGNAGNDSIYGQDGDDTINGGAGDDKIWGGKGNDNITDDSGNDEIHGQDGTDAITDTNGNNKIWGGKDNDMITSGSGNDYIYGQDGTDAITDTNGNNKIWGGKDNDMITSGSGNDEIHGQDGIDTINSSAGDDKIWGGKGNDNINSGSGNDKVQGNQDNDNIIGGDGNDWLSAGVGNDVVYAGIGDDKIFGRQGNDQLYGEDGNDIIHGSAGNDNIFGGNNNDLCYGESGNDTFNSCESIKAFNEEDDEVEAPEEPEGIEEPEN